MVINKGLSWLWRRLQEEINLILQGSYNVIVSVLKGRGPVEAVKSLEKKLVWWNPDQIYVMAGICEVTQINSQTREISLRNDNPDILVERYKECMDIISHYLRILLEPNKHQLIFAEIVGLDLACHNHLQFTHPQHQTLN